jgi:ankyrin repeat protein
VNQGADPTALNGGAFDPLVYAILQNADQAVLNYLLDFEGNPVNKMTHDGRTYLFWAALRGNLDFMKVLVDQGARTDLRDDKGSTVFLFAAGAGQDKKEVYDFLIENGADPVHNLSRSGANALLVMGSRYQNMEMIDYFQSIGMSISDTDNKGRSLLDYMAQGGNLELMNSIESQGVEIHDYALVNAARGLARGSTDLVFMDALEAKGLDVKVRDDQSNNLLVFVASSVKDLSIHNWFLQRGIDPFQVNDQGRSAFNYALARNDLKVLNAYLNDENSPGFDKNNTLILEDLIRNRDKALFNEKYELLVSLGFDFQAQWNQGMNVYHLIVQMNRMDLLNWATLSDADINAIDEQGNTPIQMAVLKVDDVSELKPWILAGARTDVETDFGESLYDLAMENEKLKNQNLDILKS